MPEKIMPIQLQKHVIRRLIKRAIKEGRLPETIDIGAILDLVSPSRHLDENISIIEQELGVKLRKQLKMPKRAEKKLEKMEEEEAKYSAEAEKFCKKYPWICEEYPIIPRYMVEEKITAKEMEKLIMERPEWIKEIDSITLSEALKQLQEEEREIEEFIKKYKPPRDIVQVLRDPSLPMEIKKNVMEEYKAKAILEKAIMEKVPKPKPRPRRRAPEIPKPPPRKIEVVGEELRITPIAKLPDIYQSYESEVELAKKLLEEQHGIRPREIIYITKISPEEWQITGVDQWGRGFVKSIRLET